jgi:eukaryotic-like serine/threonine-protein kinase
MKIETRNALPTEAPTKPDVSLRIPQQGARRCLFAPIQSSGDQSPLSAATHSLLRDRLSGVILIGFSAFSLFLIANWLGMGPDYYREQYVLIVHVVIIGLLGTMGIILRKAKNLCIYSLRAIEGFAFGIPAGFFAMLLCEEVLFFCGQQEHVHEAFHRAGDPSAGWIILIFTYSLFIPNSWKRAAIVTGILALVPVMVMILMAIGTTCGGSVYSPSVVAHFGLELLISASAATLGAYLINNLRTEIVEAQQLGQYRLIKEIGKGGMGAVYLAEHQMLRRPCAVKVIRPEQATDYQMILRFEREVQNMAKLTHWNSVEIYDYGRTEDGVFYYAMEYLPGWTLHELVDQYGPQPADRAIHILRQTCEALYEAHSIGLLHRDIKPGNILISKRGGVYDVAKLLDFGLVKQIGEGDTRLTQEGIVTGTPQFMSPEQANARHLDVRSDIYSLGTVAYYLLTGRAPFELAEPIQILIAHTKDPVQPPSQYQPDLPFDLEQIVLRCLAKRPEDRYATARELEHALAKCRDANRWTSSRAEAWWKEHDNKTTQIPQATEDQAVTRLAPV